MGGIEVQIFLVPISESYSENEVLKSRYSLHRNGILGTFHCSRIIPCVPGWKALESNRHLYLPRPPRPRRHTRHDQRHGSALSHCFTILSCFFQEKSNMHWTSVERLEKWSREADLHRHSWVKTFFPWTFQVLQSPGVRNCIAFRPKWFGEPGGSTGSRLWLGINSGGQSAESVPSVLLRKLYLQRCYFNND